MTAAPGPGGLRATPGSGGPADGRSGGGVSWESEPDKWLACAGQNSTLLPGRPPQGQEGMTPE